MGLTLFTTKSEYVAAREAAQEGVCLQRLLIDMNLGSLKPLPTMCDNLAEYLIETTTPKSLVRRKTDLPLSNPHGAW
jgi:hypothetical protein